MPLWEGDELTVSELVKRDIVAETQGHLAALREAVATLKTERAEAVARIAEIDRTLSELGAVAQPKRGRPRGKKAEPKGE